MTQQMLADEMTRRGYKTKAPAISAWEKEINTMNICQFFMLCDILDIRDINTTFHVADQNNPFSKLTQEGAKKVNEYIDVLLRSGIYDKVQAKAQILLRKLPVYVTQTVSAGTGEFMDSDNYELCDVGPEVPDNATYGVKLNGDSMEPTIPDQSIIWVQQQDTLANGEIGVFYVNGDAYCKRFIKSQNAIKLLSDNPAYQPISITTFTDFKVFGKVVAHTDS